MTNFTSMGDVGNTFSKIPLDRSIGLTTSYEDMLRSMYQSRIADFDDFTKPMIDDIQREATSNAEYDRAKKRAASLSDRVEEVAARNETLSMDGILPSQKAAMAKRRQLATTQAETAMVTSGAIGARERRMAARNQLLSIGEQLQNTGTASLAQAIQQKEQRDAAYKAAKKGYMSQVGALAGGAIGAMIGGPGGAALGASLGGAAGGAMG